MRASWSTRTGGGASVAESVGGAGADDRVTAPDSYSAVLRLPHALRVFLPALLGRLSLTALVCLLAAALSLRVWR